MVVLFLTPGKFAVSVMLIGVPSRCLSSGTDISKIGGSVGGESEGEGCNLHVVIEKEVV